MVWVYDDVKLDPDELKTVEFIRERTKKKALAVKTVKLLNMLKYANTHKFKNANHLRNSFFYDTEHTKPFFTEETAEIMFNSCHKKGGYSQTHPVTDELIRNGITYIQSFLPETVSNTSNDIYGIITGPAVTIEKSLPLVRTISNALKATAKVGESTVETAAADIAGPVGEGMVAVPVAFVGLSTAFAAFLEDDLGGAAAQIAQATPFIGPTLSTIISTIEENFRGGKRFSTYKNKRYKWRKKTKRIRSVKY